MNSITILEQPCPHCANRRIVRLGRSSELFCFNCRRRWDSSEFEVNNSYGHPFTEAELARLRIYRAAIRGGFYNDS